MKEPDQTPTLAYLILRLEIATEGDRGLDRDIAYAVGHARPIVNDDMPDVVFDPPYPSGQPRCNPIRYTTSLDAALSLVPEGWAWSIAVDQSACADVNKWGERSERGLSAKPPLALCIAVLKARAS